MNKFLFLLFAFIISISTVYSSTFAINFGVSRTNQYWTDAENEREWSIAPNALRVNCPTANHCVSKSSSGVNTCYTEAKAHPSALSWMCAAGKWDRCDANDCGESVTTSTGQTLYCDGARWTTSNPHCIGQVGPVTSPGSQRSASPNEASPGLCGNAAFVSSGKSAVIGNVRIRLIDVYDSVTARMEISGEAKNVVRYGAYFSGSTALMIISVNNGNTPTEDSVVVFANPSTCPR